MDPQENMVVIDGRTKMLQIMQDGIAGILGKRKPGFAAPLADDPQASLGPVDVLEAQIPNVARA
jgi:hypothetical protein